MTLQGGTGTFAVYGTIGSGIVFDGTTNGGSRNNYLYNFTMDNISDTMGYCFWLTRTYDTRIENATCTDNGGRYFLFSGNSANNSFITNILNMTQINYSGTIKLHGDALLFNGTNGTINLTTPFNNALIAYSNGSAVRSNIANCDGNRTISLYGTATNYLVILPEFNLTDGVQRNYTPITLSGSGNTRTIASNLAESIDAVPIFISTNGITPSSPRLIYANGSSENPTYSYDSTAGVLSFSSSIPSGVSTLQISTAAGPDLGCVQFSTQERAVFIAGIVGALSLLIFMWYSNPAMLINISVTVGIVFFITVLGSVIRGMC
jgi:hypothetical protein